MSWYSVKASADKASADIRIFSNIGGDGITAQAFRDEIASLGSRDPLRISISSDGGDVSTGFAIFNMLNRHPAQKVVTVEGLAASMAAVIAMSGDEIVMPSNAMMMIHNPFGSVAGQSDQIASFAEALATMQDSIAQTFVDRTGLSMDDVRAMMDKETWLSAKNAVAKGFADRVAEPIAANGRAFDLARFAHVPAGFANLIKRDDAKPPQTAPTLDDIRDRAFTNFNKRR